MHLCAHHISVLRSLLSNVIMKLTSYKLALNWLLIRVIFTCKLFDLEHLLVPILISELRCDYGYI